MARLQEYLKRPGSKPARRGEAAVGVGVIDIFEPLDKSRRDPPGQFGEGVGEGVRARPANLLEQGRQPPRMTGADEPKPAVFGGTEDNVMGAEQAKGSIDLARADSRDIGPDEYHRAGRTGSKCAVHPQTEIAAALAGSPDPVAPMPCTMARLVRGYGDLQTPAPVSGEPAQKQRDHQPLETHCRDIAYPSRESALADPEGRRAD